jgi:hypothetical protein
VVAAGWWLTDSIVTVASREQEQLTLADRLSIFIGVASLLAALASLVVAFLQLRDSRKLAVPAGGPSLPPGSRVRQDITATTPGAIAQGVMFGTIQNSFTGQPDELPTPQSNPKPRSD